MDKDTIFFEINECRICLSKKLNEVLNLGDQPPANSLRTNLANNLPTAPLKLVHCEHCSIVQLTATVDSKIFI